MRSFWLCLFALTAGACGPTSSLSGGACDPAKCVGCCLGKTCIAFADQNDERCGVGDQCLTCGSELTCQQGLCTPRDACLTNRGGCDVNAGCNPPPATTRCVCNASFEGTGELCVPILSTLSVRPGFLSPAFRPDLKTYSVIVKTSATNVVVTGTTVTPGATVVVNGISNTTVMLPNDETSISVQAVIVGTKGARYTIEVERSKTTLAENSYLKGSTTVADDRFGRSVAISGDGQVMAIGAPGEGLRAGAVFVYRRAPDAIEWAEEAKLRASNSGKADGFGWSLALSHDGSTLVVGVPGEDSDARGVGGNQASNASTDSGAVYVFRRAGSAWAQEAFIKGSASDPRDGFGWSVAVSADGAKLVASAPFDDGAANDLESSGAAYVLTRAGTAWAEQAVLRSTTATRNRLFGRVVALAADGATLAVGAPTANVVAVFRGAPFTFDGEVTVATSAEDDQFGSALALSGDGSLLAVGAPNESTLALSVGSTAVNQDAPGSGAVYLFRRGTAWAQEAFVKATNTHVGDVFGTAVALSADGVTLVVGAPGEDSDARGVEGDQSSVASVDSGAVFAYRSQSGTWRRHAYLKASNTSAGDVFGSAVAVSASGARLLVAAGGDDSRAVGVNGDSMNDAAMESGACFAFDE